MKILQLLLVLIMSCQLYAIDQTKIKGWVQSAEGETISFASVLIYSAIDNRLIKTDLVRFEGTIDIYNLNPGRYFIKILIPDFEAFTTDHFILKDSQEYILPIILLTKKSPNTNWLEEFDSLQVPNKSRIIPMVM